MAIKDTFVRNLKAYREKNGYTQSILAEKLSVSTPTISGWETGRKQMSFEMMDQIAALYGIPVKALFEEGAEIGFPVRAETFAEFLQCLCAAATHERVTSFLIKDSNMPNRKEIILNWDNANCSDFISDCIGALSLVEAYQREVIPASIFDLSMSGAIEQTANKNYEN